MITQQTKQVQKTHSIKQSNEEIVCEALRRTEQLLKVVNTSVKKVTVQEKKNEKLTIILVLIEQGKKRNYCFRVVMFKTLYLKHSFKTVYLKQILKHVYSSS